MYMLRISQCPLKYERWVLPWRELICVNFRASVSTKVDLIWQIQDPGESNSRPSGQKPGILTLRQPVRLPVQSYQGNKNLADMLESNYLTGIQSSRFIGKIRRLCWQNGFVGSKSVAGNFSGLEVKGVASEPIYPGGSAGVSVSSGGSP